MTAPPVRSLVFFPSYCEVGEVEGLARDIHAALPDATILCVDDASPDGTGELLARLAQELPCLYLIRRPHRMGLGSAHKLALLYARNHGFDALLTLNGDGTHPVSDLPRLLASLADADFVAADSRARSQRAFTSLMRAYSRAALESLDPSTIAPDDRSFAQASLSAIAEATGRWALLPRRGLPRLQVPQPTTLLGSAARSVATRWQGSTRREPEAVAEPVTCRICGSTEQVEVHPARDEGDRGQADVSPYSCASHSGRTHGPILRCLACDIVFMRPRLAPEALVAEYASVVDPVYLDNLPARLVTFEQTLKHIRPILGQRARVLEVGSYCGAFLRVAEDHGLDVVGLEPSRWAAEQARRITSRPVIGGTLDDVPAELAPFDAVVAWDVVEHFADPVAELRKVNRLLPLGGRFFFCTLMVDNWFPRLAGSHWPWFMDMHLFYFTETTIRELLRRSGFTLVNATPYRHITTVEYLLRKLGTLGLPGATLASRLASSTPMGKAKIPVRLGDIQLFSCTKIAAADEATSFIEPGAETGPRPSDRLLH
jgi:SAM-dependent methyltransferase